MIDGCGTIAVRSIVGGCGIRDGCGMLNGCGIVSSMLCASHDVMA